MKSGRLRVWAFFAALVSDPYRKLIAIVLAVGLWFFINGQITGSVSRTVSLTWVGSVRTGEENFGDRLAVVLPTDRVIGRRFMNGDTEIQSATVTLSGPRFKIDALANIQLDLQIAGFSGLDWSSRRDIEFTPGDIGADIRALQEVRIELDPPRIRLEVERLEEWPVRLSMDVVEVDVGDEELGKRLRLDTAEFQPPTVNILGPASAIQKFRQPGPKFLQAHVVRVGDRQVSAGVELSAGKDLGLRLAEVPTVTFQVLPVTQVFTLELPLVVDDLALEPSLRGQYQADQPSRRVRIRAGGQLLLHLANLPTDARRQEWAAGNLRLLVVVPRLEAGSEYRTEIVQAASLLLLDTSQLIVDRTERLLDEAVSVTLRRQP